MGQITDKRSSSGSVGLAVQDALSVLFDDFTVTGPKVQNDALNIVRAGNKIIPGWPTALATGVVQTANSLVSPIRWTPLTNAPVASGNQNILVVDMIDSSRFYWLSY